MTLSYCIRTFDYAAERVWEVIRPFDHYAWAGVPGETIIEDGGAGDQVGAVRRVDLGARVIRQRLLAHSDNERSYSYCFVGETPFPVWNYRATIRVTPLVADSRSFVEWWASFDCAPEERDKWTVFFEKDGFARWLAALADYMGSNGAPARIASAGGGERRLRQASRRRP